MAPARRPSSDPLDDYRAKRDFTSTPEPDGARPATSTGNAPRFLVQRHRARRLHYDLRLEIDGTLVSWAVPKGPTLDPARRSLAVHVEDHPFDYGWFEGTIAEGYGAGDVIVWDDGWWEMDTTDERGLSPREAVSSGELKFELHGRKLGGRFVLVRTGDNNDWLLIHKRDDAAVAGWNPEDHPLSVLSGRTNDDVRQRTPAHWAPPTPDELESLEALGDAGTWEVGGVSVPLSNLSKVMAPGRDGGPALTKRDLVRYYAQMAPWLAPYLAGRPVNVQRFPDGVEGKHFWQRAVPAHAPEWIRRWPNPLASEGKSVHVMLFDGAPSLAWVANTAAIELHPWTSTAANPEQPSYALVDIDPGPATSWEDTLVLARLFRTAVEHLGLVARPKVTGQRGIQIWIPVSSGATFAETNTFVETMSRTVGGVVPDLVSWRWHKDERQGRARLDYTQNSVNKTLVAPYSIRPAAGAPVSVGLEWDELDDPDLRPDRWSAFDVLERLSTRGDAFTAVVGVEQNLPAL